MLLAVLSRARAEIVNCLTQAFAHLHKIVQTRQIRVHFKLQTHAKVVYSHFSYLAVLVTLL